MDYPGIYDVRNGELDSTYLWLNVSNIGIKTVGFLRRHNARLPSALIQDGLRTDSHANPGELSSSSDGAVRQKSTATKGNLSDEDEDTRTGDEMRIERPQDVTDGERCEEVVIPGLFICERHQTRSWRKLCVRERVCECVMVSTRQKKK